MEKIYVVNFKGEKELFSYNKVFRSARRSGASISLAREIASKIQQSVYPGIKTDKIFKQVRNYLRKGDLRSGLRFNLKEAMRKLGPSGFPFEKYIGDIFTELGFKVLLNQIIYSRCARYEIDFVAQKDKLVYLGECKFRIYPGEKIDLNIALSNYARFLDIKESGYFKRFSGCKSKSILVTNAKFTKQTVSYSKDKGVDLLGWRFPRGRGLEQIIEEKKFYPITILPSFNNSLMPFFALSKKMLAKDVLNINAEKFYQKTKIKRSRIESLIKEARILVEVEK